MNQSNKNSKIAVHIIIIFILCIPITFLWYAIINSNNNQSLKTETITAIEPKVYVTTYGECYHSAGCSYLAKSQIPMGKQEAISKGYTACSRCGGTASGTITVTYTKRVEVENSSKNVWGAIGLSILCTPMAYLFIYVLLADVIENRKNKKNTTATTSFSPTVNSSTITLSQSAAAPPSTPKPPHRTVRVGDAVHHKTFGLGAIKKIEGKYFTVQFDHDEKDFIHPDVFESGIMENLNSKNRDYL